MAGVRWRQAEAAQRARERREREDAAPRLRDEVRGLRGLSITVGEQNEAGVLACTCYVRHVVVAHAPALFIIPCTEGGCEDGGHDITQELLAGLRAGQSEFAGTNTCRGYRGGEHCGRVLHYAAQASYDNEERSTG
jgi:hypothetical protein